MFAASPAVGVRQGAVLSLPLVIADREAVTMATATSTGTVPEAETHRDTLSNVMRCDEMRCDVTRCDEMRSGVMRCDAMRCSTVRCDAI